MRMDTETKVPPPPAAEVSIRTLETDIKAIASGEISPTAEVVAPPAPEAPEPNFTPETSNQLSGPVIAPQKSKRKIWFWIIILLVIIIAGVGGYLLVASLGAGGNTPVVTP